MAELTVRRKGLAARKISVSRLFRLALTVLVFAAGFGVRLVNLTEPPFDFYSTRQVRAAIIARGLYYETLPNLDPGIRHQGISAYQGMERIEPMIVEGITALAYRVAGGEYLWLSRLFTIFYWMVGGFALYRLARSMVSWPAALFALGFYLFVPFGVVASRAFLPDPLMMMWILLAAMAIERWAASGGQSWRWSVLAGLFSGIAVLVKAVSLLPVAAMLVAGFLMVFLEGRKANWALLKNPRLWVMAALSAVFAAVYYLFMVPPGGGYLSYWFADSAHLIFDRKFYVRWLGIIRGVIDVMLLFAALLSAFLLPRRGRVIVLALWLGYFLIGMVFHLHIITHEYYSLLLIPVAGLSLAAAADLAAKRLALEPLAWRAAFLVAALAISGYYLYVGRYMLAANTYGEEVTAWRQIGEQVPRNGNYIALSQDYAFRLMYFSRLSPHRVWPTTGDIENSKLSGSDRIGDFNAFFAAETVGLDYFLVTMFSELDRQPQLKAELYDHYPVAASGNDFIVFDLRNRK